MRVQCAKTSLRDRTERSCFFFFGLLLFVTPLSKKRTQKKEQQRGVVQGCHSTRKRKPKNWYNYWPSLSYIVHVRPAGAACYFYLTCTILLYTPII